MIVRLATFQDIEILSTLSSAEGDIKEEGYFERCLREQNEGSRDVLVVEEDGKLVGYCHYQRKPKYQPFNRLEIPEIQDLFVASAKRQKGFAAALLEKCCQKAVAENKDMIGIGVGLYASYGKAQRLYTKMGFVPDGGGVVYDRMGVVPGQFYKVDDALCLMMVKTLK